MQILHVSPRYLPAVGGAEKHLHEFSRRFAREGHAVRVLTTDACDAEYFWNPAKARVEQECETIDGVAVRRFAVQHFAFSPLTYRALRRGTSILSDLQAPLALVNALGQAAPYVPTLRAELRDYREPCDVVAGINLAYESLLIPAVEFARRAKLPWIIFPLTHLGDPRVKKFYTMRQQLALVRKADAVVTQTRGEGDLFRAQGIDPRRLVRVGPGVNPGEIIGGDATRARAAFQLDGRLVLFLGTVSPDKGAGVLLAAMEKVWAQGDTTTTLVYAGAVLDESRAQFQTAPRAVQARTRVLGVVSDATKNDLLAACDLLVLPSRVDSFGIVLLEAWACGKPVIGANAGGISDVIENEQDGLLVRFGEANALARAIGRVLQDPAWGMTLGERGRAKVLAEHTWDHKYRVVREVYARVTAHQPLDELAESA